MKVAAMLYDRAVCALSSTSWHSLAHELGGVRASSMKFWPDLSRLSHIWIVQRCSDTTLYQWQEKEEAVPALFVSQPKTYMLRAQRNLWLGGLSISKKDWLCWQMMLV